MTVAPFGSWDSPLTSEELVKGSGRFFDLQSDSKGVYSSEIHPQEGGRTALIQIAPGKEVDLAPEANVRTRVYEYGGGAFAVRDGVIIYSEDVGGQLVVLGKGPLTHCEGTRFADGSIHPKRLDSVWVGELHGVSVENFLAFVAEDGSMKKIAEGHDFYSSPRFSPDGKKLAFITWDFPSMQWDSSTLWLADIDTKGTLSSIQKIAGGKEESVCQVQWSPEGVLHFVSDKTGYWNLYKWNGKVEPLCEMEAEFGVPAWVFGRPTYAFLSGGNILASYIEKGISSLGILDSKTKRLTRCTLPFTAIFSVVVRGEKGYFIGASPQIPSSLIEYDIRSGQYTILRSSTDLSLPTDLISVGELISYPSLNGKEGYAFYYPPKNPKFNAPKGELPPLIVQSHGGPTAQVFCCLSTQIQFWTSRGYAFVDVNYGGSTGYGREYFKRLEGNWGIVDVQDCISAAKTLAARGIVDEKRLLIRGGSAGGYTTLLALATTDLFAAGTSYYGVSDIALLCQDSHKFESKYADLLVAPYPEQLPLINERSPIYHLDSFSTPLLLLQGGEDKIVPPNQSFAIYDKLKEKGCPVAIILFPEEGHGFRKAENLKRSLDAELYFYTTILGIPVTGGQIPPPVVIENLDRKE